MARCELCLSAGADDVAPSANCVRRVMAYIDLNQRLIRATLAYHHNETPVDPEHASKCSKCNELQTYGRRRRLRAEAESLLHKRIATGSLMNQNSYTTSAPFFCPDLIPNLEDVFDIPEAVQGYLAAADEWLTQEEGSQFNDAADADLVPRKELRALQDLKEKHLGEFTRAPDRCKDKVSGLRGAAECLATTGLIQKYKIPREIREIIYYYTFFDEEPRRPDLFYCDRPRIRRHLRSPFDWGLDPEYVGKQLALEVEERYYTEMKFELRFYGNYLDFATSDFCPLGFDVHKFRLIRNISINHELRDIRPEYLKKLSAIYDQLNMITHRDLLNVDIYIDVQHAAMEPHVMLNVLEAIRKPIYDLKHAGSNLELELCISNARGRCPMIWYLIKPDNGEGGHWTHYSDEYHKLAKHGNDIFTLTKEEWEKEKLEDKAQDSLLHSVQADEISFVSRERDLMLIKQIRSRLIRRWGATEAMRSFLRLSYIIHGGSREEDLAN